MLLSSLFAGMIYTTVLILNTREDFDTTVVFSGSRGRHWDGYIWDFGNLEPLRSLHRLRYSHTLANTVGIGTSIINTHEQQHSTPTHTWFLLEFSSHSLDHTTLRWSSLHAFRYYAEEVRAPIPTVFVGGNHEASGYLQELPYGGWVAPNIWYLGEFPPGFPRALELLGSTLSWSVWFCMFSPLSIITADICYSWLFCCGLAMEHQCIRLDVWYWSAHHKYV